MRIVALTGGIASGKSTAGRLLTEMLPSMVFFDCDACVHQLLESDAALADFIRTTFGDQAFDIRGKVDRHFLRTIVFTNDALRFQLEAALHPRVREECLDSLQRAVTQGAEIFIADVPLLFEKRLDFGQTQIIVVASSPSTQVQRLKSRNGYDSKFIESILSTQISIFEKIAMADVVFWNEGLPAVLRSQILRYTQSSQMNLPNESNPAEPHDETTAVAEAPLPPVSININEFRLKSLAELQAMAEAVPARIQGGIPKAQLIYELLCFYSLEGSGLTCEGVLELAKDSFAMLRDSERSFRPSPDDIHFSANLMRDFGLRVGQRVKLRARAPRERGKYLSGYEILEIEGRPAAEYHAPKEFDKLTPLFPNQRIHLEGEGVDFLGVRVIDLIAPLGKGQRGIIVAPPRGGKTILLKQIARSIRINHPDAELIILLLDERPEEVTEFRRALPGTEIYASSNDEQARNHCRIAELAIERAKRLVEAGKDVFLLMDSITRLARAYNGNMNQRGRGTGSGGITIGALEIPRRLFAAARNTRGGGSLTILATALIQTNSRADEAIFMEFKGTGNMELVLDRKIAENYIYPAVDIFKSGTRREELLLADHMLHKIHLIRRGLAGHRPAEAMERLLFFLKKFPNNPQMLMEIKG